MQAAMTMNTVALGGIERPTARVAAKKSVTFGAPVAPKSATGFSVRRSVKPATVAMAADAEPIMEAPMKGIMDDMKARAPLYIDDFKQGISTKSLVRAPPFLLGSLITFVFIVAREGDPARGARASRGVPSSAPPRPSRDTPIVRFVLSRPVPRPRREARLAAFAPESPVSNTSRPRVQTWCISTSQLAPARAARIMTPTRTSPTAPPPDPVHAPPLLGAVPHQSRRPSSSSSSPRSRPPSPSARC